MAPNLQAGALQGYALNRTRLRPELPMAEPRRHRPQDGRTLVAFNGRGDTPDETLSPGLGAWANHTFGS